MRRARHLAACCLALALVAVGCGGGDPAADTVPAQEAASEVMIDAPILDHPSRSEDDHYRDAGFKPVEVYGFLGIEPGLTVGDFMPSRGYNTVLVSQIVGDDGRVVAILRPDAGDPERVARSRGILEGTVETAGLNIVETVDDLAATPEGSLDVLLTVRNYHDLGEHDERIAVLPDIMRTLKARRHPGGE